MTDTRRRNTRWLVSEHPDIHEAQLAVLMDLREELQKLNGLLHCANFQAIPSKLDAIVSHTAKRKRRKTKGRT